MPSRGRASVFHGPSDVLYSGTGKSVTISSSDGGRVAIATAPANASYPTRLVTAAETPVELRGAGNCSRQVHNFGTPAALEADRFIVCEVITPAGNWSSYPPHKHDEEKDGETHLEEIYYFETQVAAGSGAPADADAIGYQRVYASDERPIDVSAEVRTGDVVLVPYGWHGPAMAAPGYDMYYLNVMAGPGPVREWLISDDPHHGWVRQSWDGQRHRPPPAVRRLVFGMKMPSPHPVDAGRAFLTEELAGHLEGNLDRQAGCQRFLGRVRHTGGRHRVLRGAGVLALTHDQFNKGHHL